MPFDIASARAAKKSDTEIADYLGGSLGFDVAAARKLGKTDTEIAEYLSTHERPASIKPDAVMGNEGVAFKPVSLGDTFSGEQMAQQAVLADPNSPDATNRSVLKDKGFVAASADARGDMPARKTEAKAKVNAASAGFEKKDAAAKKGEGVAPRTATEGVNDLYVAGKQGLLNVNAGGSWLLDQIPGVDTGGFTASQLEESKRLNDDKSEYLKDANKAVEDADGFFDTMGTLIDNPAAIGDLIAQNASFVIPGMATGAAGAKIGGAMAARKAAQVGATEQAIAAAALAGRTTGAAVGGTAGESAISGGISGAQVEEQILGTEFSVLEQKSARYRELSTRMSPEQAREQLADEVSLATAAATGGATAVGGIMANKANKLLGLGDPYANALVQQVTAKTALKSTAGEVVQEMTQSPLEQIGGNLTNVDDSTAWDEDVTKSIALGAVGALGQSAGTQAIGMGVQSLKGEAPPANPAAGGIAPPVTDPISGATPDPISGAATTPEATVTASVVQAPASIPAEAELQADADALSARSQEKAALADEARAMGNLEMADQLEAESQTAAAAAKQALDTIEVEHTGLTGIANRTGIADAPAILPLSADEVGKGQLDAGNRAALGLDQLRDDEELQPVVAPAEPALALPAEQAPVAKAPSAQFDSTKPIADLTTADDMNLRKRAAYVRSSIRASSDEKFKAAAKAELKALTAEIDGRNVSPADPATVNPDSVPAPVTAEASPIAGEAINAEWTAFAPDSGTLSIPRAEMPQIKAEHRGAMVNFLKARGITSDENVVKADSLKPTQAEFSPGKVEKAKSFTGGDRSILVSSDNHILDGHHQWLAKRDAGEDVKVIKLGAPIKSLLSEVAEFPSATTDDLGADDAPVIDTSPVIPADKRDGADLPPETMQQKAVRIARMRMEGQLNFTDLTARDAKGKALTAARQAGMTSDEIADIEAVAENTAESMAEFWSIGAQLLNEEVAKRNPEPPKGSKPAEIHYPNRKLGFERAKADPDDPHNTNAMANIALANLQPDDKVTVNGVTMTVKSIGSKAVTFTKSDGKTTRFDIDTPRMEQLVRDVEGLIGASHHSTHGRDWVSVLSRDPTFGRSNGVISLRDGDTGATASVDDMNLTARRSRIGRALDQLSDNEVHAVYRRMGLAGEMLPVDEKRAALKQERPEDIEPALKIDQPAEQRTDTDRRQADQPVANEQRQGARRVDAMTPEEMRQALLINPLTDLPNKRAFEEDADLGWPHVAAMDIDGFGFLNDIWGHDPVDAILKQIGGMMSEFSTDAVRLYHRSGDEFAARSNDKKALQLVLKSLQDHLEASTFTVDGIGEDGRPLKFIKHGIGVTFGISTDYQRADNEAIADKERRLAAGKRGAKGSNPGGMVEVDAQGTQANLGSRGLSRQETERLRNRGSEGGLDPAQEASNRKEDSRQKKSERMRALNAERARLNPADELLTAIAKLGGLSKADAEAQGIDPADFKQKRAGIMFVFKPAGKSFDAMAEALDAEGYPVQDDQGRYSANKLLDLVTDSLSGKPVYTSSGHEAVMAAEDIQRALEDGDVAALPPSEHIDGTQAESVAAVRLIDAVNAGYDWSIVGSMIGENDTEADMHRLFSGLIAGEQDYVDRYNAQAASAGTGQEDYSPAQQEQEDDIPGFSPEGQDQGDLTDAEMERHVFDRVPQDQIRAERQAESFSLEAQSEADLAAKEAREQDEAAAAAAETTRQAEASSASFQLSTGIAATSEQVRPAVRGGGRSLFDAPVTTRGERLQEGLIAIDGELGMALGELASALRDLTPPGQVNTFVDPVVMGKVLAVGMKASVLYLQKGAVKFAIWANNMIVGLEGAGISPDVIKPYLSQLYLASKASVDKSIRSQMDGEDFVLDYDVETIGSKSEEVQAPSQAAEPAATATVKWFGTRAKADEHIEKKRLSSTHEVVQVGQRFEIHEKPKQGEANGSAELGEGSQGALAGVPAREGEAAAGQRSAGGGAARGSRADAQGNDRAGESGLQGARSLGNDTREVSVPEAGSAGGRAAGSAGAEPVRGSADADESTVAVGGITAAVPATQLGADFAITDSDEVGVGGAKTKFKNNIAAIVLLKELERQGRPATRDEQSILAKYVGWGGIPQAFSRDGGAVTQGWERQATELREILTPDEYSAAAASTMNAHYTATEIVSGIWDAVQQFGFNGGAVLEPSVGTGNFFGKMPHGLRNASALVGVELDHITGGIAKLLYPAANIQSPMGFQDITVPDGHFDLAIGNPPFGSTQIHDGSNPAINRMSIHNYFFAKSVLGLKPNGVLAMVVTNRMMDAGADRARQFIADRTELLGAIRLPNDAFLKNAGTSVTTDIIFLRRLEEGETATGESWTKVRDYSDKDGKTVPLNEYFHRNPDMMLGDFGAFGTMYREGDSALVAKPGQDTMKLMQEAIKKLPRDFMPTVQRAPTREVIAPVGDIDAIRVGSMFMQGGEIHVRMEDELGQQRSKPVVAGSAKSVERIKGMIAIRDALTTVRELQLSETSSEAAISKARAQLNKSYDAFVKANGPINQDTNKRAFRDDPTWPQISALEEGFEKGVSAAAAKATGLKQEGPSAKKAAIFTKRTQAPYRAPESAASAKDALVASLSELGRVDLAYMSKLYGKDESEIAAELSGMIYQNPVRGWETADEYLSGNVKQKLAIAEEAAKADPQFDKNVSALQDVQPADIEAVDISVKLGAHWVPVTDVAAFAKHITGDKTATAGYVSLLAKWTIDAKAASASIAAQWGTDRATIEEIMTAAANQRTIQIKDKVSEDKYVVNEAATQAANEKVEALKNEWTRWLWSDDARRERLARQYNDTFNTDRQREYDGSHLKFPGKVDLIGLRPHQSNAAWRIIQSATTLTDHVVGAGKTYTLIAAAMEMRRMGRANKPMFVVPNHLVGQWAADFVRLYPGANVLAASKKDFDKENRKRMFARIATGDWDAVIVAHSSFGKIGVHPDFVAKFIRDQIADIEVSITATREAEGKSSRNVKQIEKQKAALEEKLKDLFAQKKKDDSLYFDELGIDGLFLDEAHEFKNLQFSTSMSRIAGVPNSHSQKASDLFMKVQQVQQRTGGRNIVFATGTPISNSMAEMFTMQRYLDYKTMKDQGLAHFDAWARMYGEVVTDWELSPSGQYKMNSRFAKFVNMPELMQRYASFADVINREDINRQLAAVGKKLPVPNVKGGKPQNIIVERSAAQADYIGVASMDEYGNEKYPEGSLVWRAENLPKGAAAKEKGADNMLKIMSDARKAALDMRLIDPDASDNPKSKVNEAADRMVTIYHKWTDDKGAQLVFIDLSTPKSAQGAEASRIRDLIAKAEDGDSDAQEALDKLSPDELDALNAKFDVYNDLRDKLIARGIPAEEIAFIHSANTDAQKDELFGRVKSGRTRFLFGSTAKMGAGMNVQERLVALHHLDAPWRPSDLEQREGRIIRQENALYNRDPDGFEVEINRYATKQTLDSRMWQTIEAKARFIEQVRKGATGGREVEDIAGEAANAAEMKAASSGNPLILEEMELRQKLRKMNNEESEHDRQQHRVRAEIRSITNGMEASERLLVDTLADSKLVPASFAITIKGKLIEKHKEAGAAILLAAAPYIMDMSARAEEVTVGEYGDFTIKVEKTSGDKEKFWLGLETARGSYQVGTFSLDADPTGMAIRMANTVKQLPEKAAEREAKIAAQKADLPKLEAQIKPWPKAADLAATKAQHAGIIEKLKPKKADPAQAAAPAKKDDDVNYSKDSGWYSPLTRTVEGIKQETALAGMPLFSVGKGKGSLTAVSLEKQLRDGPAGTAIGKMLDDGKIVIHNTVPAGRDATAQGWTTKSDGTIHLVANRLTTGTVSPTLFHELFHRGMRLITGTASHKRLMKELEATYKHYRGAPAGSATNKFWMAAMGRLDAALVPSADQVEEFGAYAVTAFESAPRSLRKWIAEFVGHVKAWLLRTTGMQLGGVTPGQMRAIAVHALRAETSGRAAPVPEDDAASVNYSKANTATVGDTYKLPPARTFITKIFDRFDRLNQVQKAVTEQGGSVTDLSDVYGQEEAYHSRAASAIDRFRRHRVGGLFKRMVKAGIAIEDVGLYLYAQHAPERNAQIAKLYQNGGQLNLTGMGNQHMQDGGSGMTNKEAADHMAEFQQRGIARKLDTFARELRDITKDSREILRNSGLETSAAIDAWEAAYQFYVPLSGKDEANNASSVIVGRGFDVRGGQRRAMGRKDMAKHVIEQIIIQHEQAVIRAEKNLVGKRLLQFVRDNPDDKLWQVNPVEQRRYIAADGQAEYRNQPLRTDRNVVSVRINGKDTFVLLADQGMADAIHNVGTEDVGFLLRALGVVSRFTSKMFTAFSPAFIAVNALRDFQTAMLHGYQVGGIKYSANIVKNIPGALAELVRDVRKGDSKLVKLYEQSGGRTGMVYMIKDFEEKHNEVMHQMAALKGVSLAEIMQAFEAGYKEGFQAVGRKARYNKFTGVFDALVESVETVNGVMENMTRLAAFKAAIDEGKSTKEAGSIAKNLTVNFNRKGELAPTLGSLYIFFNASVQGTVRMAEALKNPKLQAVAVGMVLLSAALAAMQMGDDDDKDEDGRPDFEQIPAYQRSRNLIFMHDDGSYTKIPLPLGWNVFHSFGTELAVMARSKSREAYGTGAWNILKGTVEMFNPVGDLTPSVAAPFLQIANNESHFGGPIYPEYKDKLPNSQQFYDGTEGSVYERATTMANEVTGGNEYRPGMVDVNPEKLQHVVEFFGGGALRFLTDTADAVTAAADGGPLQPVDKLPIARAFVGQLRDEYQTSRYYENVGKVEAIAAEIKGLEESGKLDEMAAVAEKNPMTDSLAAEIRITKKALKQLKQHEREVRADEDLSEGELRQALQDIREERGQIVKPFNSMYEDAMRKGQ